MRLLARSDPFQHLRCHPACMDYVSPKSRCPPPVASSWSRGMRERTKPSVRFGLRPVATHVKILCPRVKRSPSNKSVPGAARRSCPALRARSTAVRGAERRSRPSAAAGAVCCATARTYLRVSWSGRSLMSSGPRHRINLDSNHARPSRLASWGGVPDQPRSSRMAASSAARPKPTSRGSTPSDS